MFSLVILIGMYPLSFIEVVSVVATEVVWFLHRSQEKFTSSYDWLCDRLSESIMCSPFHQFLSVSRLQRTRYTYLAIVKAIFTRCTLAVQQPPPCILHSQLLHTSLPDPSPCMSTMVSPTLITLEKPCYTWFEQKRCREPWSGNRQIKVSIVLVSH